MQTGLVHTRHPLWSMRRVRPLRSLAFIMFILGTPVSLMLNPLVWGVTILYIASRLAGDSAGAAFIRELVSGAGVLRGHGGGGRGEFILFFQTLTTPIQRQRET